MGIKRLIKQQNSKQKKDIAPNSKEFRSWFLRKVIDNDKNNSLNIWILNNPKIWGTHLNRREVVMSVNIQDDQSWTLSETVQKFPESTIRPAGSRFYSVPVWSSV